MTSTKFIALLAGASLSFAAQAVRFDDWADKVADAKVRNDPEQATQKQYFSAGEQDALDRKLTPNTIVYRSGEVAAAKKSLAQLAKIKRNTLTPQQRASAATIAWNLQSTIDAYPYIDYSFPFNQFTGVHVQIVNFLTQAHPIRNRRDIENYLVRLRAVPGKIETGILQARGTASRGILMPTFITQASIGQLDRFLDGAPENNVFVATLAQRMGALKDVSAEDQASFAAEATSIVKQWVIPSFENTRALLKEQLPRTNNDAGLWRLPKGDKAYAVVLRQMTSTDYTPEQIHNIGLKEVARIEKEMEVLLVSIGYTEGTIKQRIAKLEKDQQPKEADPRPALLARYEDSF